jgi:hypothetical protein
MTGTIKNSAIAILVLISLAIPAKAIDVSTLGHLVGWTVAEDTNISGEFEGADYDKVAKLDNGHIIEFHEYDYFYEYHPEIVIFAKKVGNLTLYRAVIEGGEEVYDITFVK